MHEVRPEQPQDFTDIRTVHERAFAPSRQEADLVEALRASGAHVPELCLVGLREGIVVAHITFSRAHLDSEHHVLALAPMAVLPERQRQGFGSALVSEGLRRAAEMSFPMVVVLGHATYYPGSASSPPSHSVSPLPSRFRPKRGWRTASRRIDRTLVARWHMPPRSGPD